MENPTTIKKYYRTSENFQRYFITNTKRVKEIRKMLSENDKFFGRNILDIACGGGILGFLLEKKQRKYVGIDINPDMISAAKSYSKEVKSKNKFILGDVTTQKIIGKFDTFSFLGNAIGHFTTNDFVEMLEKLKGNVKKNSYFIVEYRDVVDLLFRRQWKTRMVEKNKGKTIISITTGSNMKKGEIYKKAFDTKGGSRINFMHAIWSPFIVEPIMRSFKWKLVKRNEKKNWNGWLEIYQKF